MQSRWQTRAACSTITDNNGRQLTPSERADIFFLDENMGRKDHRQTDIAKAICSVCPVRVPCLEFAINGDERGIWGGTTEFERRNMT